MNDGFLKCAINDYGKNDLLRISQEITGLHEESVMLDKKDLKNIIQFCIEEGFLDWDCSECPIQ